MGKKYTTVFSLLLLGLTSLQMSYSAEHGTIQGQVTDVATGDPLPGANVFIVGTAIGVATDLKGSYQLLRVPLGSYTLRVRFIGYRTKEVTVQLLSGETKTYPIQLQFDAIKGESVKITAQAVGQVAAINQQLRSNTITNVVSAERIQEIPDANAAESVGRLPGISILRSGGEGNKVVIRGLAPTYNSITIGGERIPATDFNDRSVDLNMISPEILEAIEVTKALTPDKDADSFGGSVDFKLANASESGIRRELRFQEGYNSQRNEYGQYKGSITLSNRYWEKKLGLMVTGNIERAQRGSDEFSAGYYLPREKRENETSAPISVSSVSLYHINEDRKRMGFTMTMDYKLPRGRLLYQNYMYRLDRDQVTQQNKFRRLNNHHDRTFNETNQQTDLMSNSLTGEYNLPFGRIDLRLSRTGSLNRQPYENLITFRETGAFDVAKIPEICSPDVFIQNAYNNLELTHMYEGEFTPEKKYERDMTAQVNLEIPYVVSKNIAGFLKLGGKLRNKRVERDKESLIERLDSGSNDRNFHYAIHHTGYGNPSFVYLRNPGTGRPSIYNYLDPAFDAGSFLGGNYDFGPGFERNELNRLLKTYMLDSLYAYSTVEDGDDYEASEEVSAAYVMTEINFGRFLMLMPGVRYERTRAYMTGRKVNFTGEIFDMDLDKPTVTDTSAVNTYARWFPMFHVRLKPIDWFDVRLAYTRSLSRPRLDWMMPKKIVNGNDRVVTYGRPDLKPQISTNYDVFLSFYGNTIGLFTLGGFYKQIDELIFSREGHTILNAEKEGFTKDLQGFILNRPENNPYKTKVKGFEVEWQTHLKWLPNPFNGIVINANYTHIWSKTYFPRSFVKREKLNVFPFLRTTNVDTFRVGNMLDQPNDIANIAVGYDMGPFSARVSMLFQGKTLSGIGERPELDGFTDNLIRWDLSVKYTLSKHISFFLNVNNISNHPDKSFQQAIHFLTAQEYYGWTSDFGFGFKF